MDGCRIMYINPIGTCEFDEGMGDSLRGVAVRDDTTLDVVSMARGPHHVEYHYYEALVLPDLLHTIMKAEKDGYDAAVIGCFYDFGLKEAREITTRMVVTAPAESAALMACSLGDRFSILVGRRKSIPDMRDNIHRIGLRDRLASLRSVNLGVLDFQVDHGVTLQRFVEAGRLCIEQDGAEVLILGCTATFGFYQNLQDALGVPVIDATIAPVKYAEYLVDMRRRFGWQPSKVGLYETPRAQEIADWGLLDQYAEMKGLWTE